MSRLDAVNYISHGIAKKPGLGEQRGGARRRGEGGRGEARARQRGAQHLLHQPQRQGARRQDRRPDRPRPRDRAHDPDPLPAIEEQPALRGRPGRRQDGHRRGAGAADHPRRGPGDPQERRHLRARHGGAARRHALPRRLRGAPQGRDHGARGEQERRALHRRDPHRHRCRRHLRRLARRLQHPEAGAGLGCACAASARPPTRSSGPTSRRTGRWSAASRRSTSPSRRRTRRSRSSRASGRATSSITA